MSSASDIVGAAGARAEENIAGLIRDEAVVVTAVAVAIKDAVDGAALGRMALAWTAGRTAAGAILAGIVAAGRGVGAMAKDILDERRLEGDIWR